MAEMTVREFARLGGYARPKALSREERLKSAIKAGLASGKARRLKAALEAGKKPAKSHEARP